MRGQRGSALVVAVFLLVVLALLGAAAVRITGVQGQTVSLELLGARALQAARAGLEWGSHRAIVAGSCLNASTTLAEAALAGFAVTVSCSSSTHTEGPATVTIYVISAQASAGNYGQPDFVSRRLRRVLTDG